MASKQVAATKTATPAPAKQATTTKPTNPVPETVLKKRRTQRERIAEQAKKRADARKKRSTTRQVIYNRAEKYAREYRAMEKSLIRFRRQAKASKNYFIEPEAKLAVVVRIRGITGLHPKPRKILQLLRLRQINNAVFVRLNKATLTMLKLVEPYIAYGYPNQKTVKDLVYKRGYAKVDGQRIPIMDNKQIEEKLGKHGLICAEDLVHEIYTVGPHFKEANSFLWPFKLNTPKGGWNYVKTHFTEGGDAGNREDQINSLFRRMI